MTELFGKIFLSYDDVHHKNYVVYPLSHEMALNAIAKNRQAQNEM
jgi:hypothetical protein